MDDPWAESRLSAYIRPAGLPQIPTPTQAVTAVQVPAAVQVPTAEVLDEDQVPTSIALEDLEDDSEMWNMYLDEVKGEDNQVTGACKEGASDIVVFTGIFSVIVGAFIIEFYKKLSTDQTVALLQQISQQLPNSPNVANSNTAIQLSPPGTAMVWVNILWLISLVLSLTCALIATLLQQWARRYVETPKYVDVLRHRARVRSLLLMGARLYKIPFIIEMLPILLHLSVFLFFGGLAITFHTIHKKVAIAVDVSVGLSGLAYIAMSVLPCLDLKCPYRTPVSQILWYPCHAFLSFAALCLHSCIRGLQGFQTRNPFLSHWSTSREFAAHNHRRFFADGLKKSILYRAIQILRDGDRRRIAWLFNQLALGDRSKFLKFAASIPRHQISYLISPTGWYSPGSLPLPSLLVLLRTCVAGTSSWTDEDIHKRSLLVCLHAIGHIAKAPTLPDLDFMRAHLANTDHMGPLWRNGDIFLRATSRSICALVARKVVRKSRLGEEDLRWLQEVIGESPNAILEASVVVRDQMNFKAFVIGVLPPPPINLPTEDATLFNETLAILLNEGTYNQNHSGNSDWLNRLSEEIGWIHQRNPDDGREVFDRLHAIFPSLVAPFLSSTENPSPILPQALVSSSPSASPLHSPADSPSSSALHVPHVVPHPPTVVHVSPSTLPQPTIVVEPTPACPPPSPVVRASL